MKTMQNGMIQNCIQPFNIRLKDYDQFEANKNFGVELSFNENDYTIPVNKDIKY